MHTYNSNEFDNVRPLFGFLQSDNIGIFPLYGKENNPPSRGI